MAENNWKPIETAPRDEGRMLLWARASLPDESYSIEIGRFDPDLGWVIDVGQAGVTQIEPSQWMPLPDPPKAN
jgi:hypothetical protein